ncbi:MAG: tetratricopeptide repeat protein [Raineya sp.]|jgi:serine phosphatase RsbU (regulator of sigma subunit)/tetratricopeptide (TPR) repeat protein|nr:tetratricopeptide repeat protein [Raineya sp.]
MRYLIFSLFFLGKMTGLLAQNLDSMQKAIKVMPNDTLKVIKLNELAMMNVGRDPQKGYLLADDALRLSEKIHYEKGIALSYKTLGNTQYMQGSLQEAGKYYQKGLDIAEKIQDKDAIASLHNNLGLIVAELGDYEKAMQYHLKALKFREMVGDKKGVSKSYLNIGNVLLNQENLNEALQYYEKSLEIAKSINLMIDVGNNYNNIGNIHKRQKKYQKSIEAYSEASKVFEQLGDIRGLVVTDLNLGDAYLDLKEYQKALEVYNKAIPLATKLNEKILAGLLYSSKGTVQTELQNYGEAYENLRRGLNMLQDAQARNDVAKVYGSLSSYYEKQGDYKEALRFYKQFKELKDSLFTEGQTKQIAKMREAYSSEKKERENELLRKDNALKDAEGQRKNVYIFASLAVLGLVGALAFVLFRNNKEKQKTNQLLQKQAKDLADANSDILQKNIILEQQKEEILAQRDAIDEQNKVLNLKNEQIQSSIRAAQLIQNTILPYSGRIKQILGDYFIFYQPKDVVSGDLYWIDQESGKNIVAAIDCTGHGVSGAMMTMIAYSILDRIVHVYKITDPATILEKMHEEVKHALLQDETGNRDGMDVAIMTLEKNGNNTTTITFAGAKRPLFVQNIENNEIEEIRGKRRAIGGFQDENIHFENHVLELPKGTMLYLNSDGYADQNDVARKKFSEERLRKLFEKIATMNTQKQHEIVSELIKKYMENTEQRDDMLLIGVRV